MDNIEGGRNTRRNSADAINSTRLSSTSIVIEALAEIGGDTRGRSTLLA